MNRRNPPEPPEAREAPTRRRGRGAESYFTRKLTRYHQIIVFALVGVFNTGVDFGLFSLLRYTQPQLGEELAQAAGYTAGLVCSFFLNKYVTFQNRTSGFRQTLLFILCNAATLSISVGAIALFHGMLGLQEHLAKLFLVTPLTMTINFLSYKFIVFRSVSKRDA